MYVYVFYTYDVIKFGEKTACTPLPRHYDVITIMSSIETVLACVVPSVVIVVLNVRIIIKIHHYQMKRKKIIVIPQSNMRCHSGIHTVLSTAGSVDINCVGLPDNNGATSCPMLTILTTRDRSPGDPRMLRSRSQFRTARMLLIISSVFILFNLPSHIFQVLAFLHHLLGGSAKQSKQQRIWQEVFQLVYFVTFAINFFIYSACGHQFRMGLKQLWKRL
jgi:thyrotropin-releasing hormone receptor